MDDQRRNGIASFCWNDLDMFRLLCNLKSLGRVAKVLGVSQSTMSRRLNALERDFGTRLFERSVDGVIPTKAAEILTPLAERMCDLASQIVRRMSGLDCAIDGQVRVAMPEALATFLILPRLPAFQERYPQIDLEILGGIRNLDLGRNEADLALRFQRPAQGPFKVRRVGVVKYGVFLASMLRDRFGDDPELSDLEWVTWSTTYEQVPDAAWLYRTLKNPKCVLRLQSLVTIVHAVQSGVGAALLPIAIGRTLKDVVEVPISVKTPEVPIWLVMHRDKTGLARIQVVADFLVNACNLL